MADKTQRSPLVLDEQQRRQIQTIAQSRTAPLREVQRAKVLLAYADHVPLATIATQTGTSRPTVYKCIDKALSMGWEAGLKDLYHRPKDPTITREAKVWVVSVACTPPVSLGLAAEIWTHKTLARHIRTHAREAGHPCLSRAAKSTVQRILDEQELTPHKVRCYLERRDPDFDRKMREVLMVYREVSLDTIPGSRKIYTVSVDEKPGVQALGVTAPDLSPVPGKHPAVSRDHEYVRMGTLSILAALDLHDGHVLAQVHERHRSREFVELLKELDQFYPPEAQIRLILDNHSAHISQETRAYLASRPNRFVYVHTPKHGSWLNLVETLFSKMSRTFLRHIRVATLAELKERILKGVQEINENPVIHRWRNFDALESEAKV
jgi:transposase